MTSEPLPLAEPEAAFLSSNLAVLKTLLSPEAYETLRLQEASDRLAIVATGGPRPTALYDGRLVYSRNEPYREAERVVRREVSADSGVCLFESFGLGYHVEAFLELHPRAHAVVVEPDVGLFLAGIASRDLTGLLSSERLHLLLAAEPEIVPMVLDAFPHSVHSVVRLRAFAAKDRSYFERLRTVLAAYYARRDINRNTLARFGKRWVRNLLRNAEIVARSPGVATIAGLFSGRPALLLTAGPSLDAALPSLKELAQRCVVIAVDTSLRAARASGVRPDFLVVVDPQYWNSRHLDWCAQGRGDEDDRPILVSESSTYPRVFQRHAGRTLLCGSLFPLGSLLESRLGEKGALGAGGSVSTTAWDFARLLGCSPIYAAGLDLGFPGRRTHFKGAFFEERAHTLAGRLATGETHSFHALHDAAPFLEANMEGGVTLTDRRLIVYKWWFENQLKIHPDADTRSIGAEGVRIDGLKLATVAEIASLPSIRAEIDRTMSLSRDRASPDDGALDALATVLRGLSGEMAGLRDLASEGMAATEELSRALASGRDPRAALRRLEGVDGKILKERSRHVAGFLLQETAEELGEESASPQAAADRSAELYGEIARSACYHLGLIDKTLARLAENARQSR